MLFIAYVGMRGGTPRALACRSCGTRVADEAETVPILGRPVRATYTNPLGAACEILTLKAAHNVTGVGSSTQEHTWFEGYAWRVLLCASCGTHLGWRYEAADPAADPADFVGLLVSALAAADAPGRG